MNNEIKLGDDWPYHYRGTRYHYNADQIVWWQTFKDGLKVHVKKGHERIVKELLPLKTEGGSFRITETGDVIAKVEDNDDWKPIYICEMDEPFKIEEDLDITPKDIQPGDLWLGYYDGSRYSILLDKVWWRNPEGPRQYIEQQLPSEVLIELRRYKGVGGSFRITENGYVITLIKKQPLPNNLKKQWEKLSDVQQRLIAVKVERTDMLPIYIGKFHEGITLQEPRDLKKPLSEEERKRMLNFLDSFSISSEFEGMVPIQAKTDKERVEDEFHDDPED